ncbi:hypothetical protein STBA_40490 [Streptomyces sp. MP131-18]|nr:hypothetical protein STBA_40490 [Streptomyces sp. MP131-18]
MPIPFRRTPNGRRARRQADASARRSSRARRHIPSDSETGGGEAFADRNARSITRWFRS